MWRGIYRFHIHGNFNIIIIEGKLIIVLIDWWSKSQWTYYCEDSDGNEYQIDSSSLLMVIWNLDKKRVFFLSPISPDVEVADDFTRVRLEIDCLLSTLK